MDRKVQKTLSMPLELATRLEEEENQSATTAEALRDYFDQENR